MLDVGWGEGSDKKCVKIQNSLHIVSSISACSVSMCVLFDLNEVGHVVEATC